ncbi:p53-like transcription factor [Corynespora cassiicola Philippines]|uniref:p53-like transcription factor n=1 Tax=Corynespora cassiicola Philippines TaxID=1448308 RepID=A0A2T2NTT1_CORCC|nr:p53-like transcription factor [Corynespora cassiicola Philippines]
MPTHVPREAHTPRAFCALHTSFVLKLASGAWRPSPHSSTIFHLPSRLLPYIALQHSRATHPLLFLPIDFDRYTHAVIHPLPLGSGNPFSSEQECIDHSGHANHTRYPTSDPLRTDGDLGQSTYSTRSLGFQRPEHHYSTAVPYPDSGSGSGSGSISASPGSGVSFQPFHSSTYQSPSSYSNLLATPFPFPQSFGTMSSTRQRSSITESSSSATLPHVRSPGMGNPVSPSMGVDVRNNYTTTTPGLHRHPHALSPRHSDISRYSTLPDTPRSTLQPTGSMSLPPSTTYSMPYGAQPDRTGETPPFNAQETFCDITCEGATVTPSIEAKIEKGFFYSSDRVWTCYRRNYFAVSVSYGLTPWFSGARLYLNQGNGKPQEQIQSMAVSLAAAVDNSAGKSIELIQHTPKRDKGPQLPMKKELLAPAPPGKSHDHTYSMNTFHQPPPVAGPQLPLQNENEASAPYNTTGHTSSNYSHSFDRIQFKSATANNGKRRAQQQYYHLIVELWANVQSPRDTTERWIKVAQRTSYPVVVRGRSPSHYHNEGPQNPSSASRGSGGSGLGGIGRLGLGSNSQPTFGGYSNGLSGGGGGSGAVYRGNAYSLNPSPAGSHSVSSASSLSGGPVEGLVGDQHLVDDEDTKMMDNQDYQYYPAPIYEGLPSKSEGMGLPLPDRRIKEEYSGPAAGWQVGGCGRYQGMETSRGLYPDVHAHAHAGY